MVDIGDERFFGRTGPHDLATVAQAAGGKAVESTLRLRGVAPLQSAGPDEVSFLDNRRYLSQLAQTKAGAVVVHPAMAEWVPDGCVAIVTETPYRAWALVASLFHPLPPVRPGIHPTALVDPTASVDATSEIGPFAVIEANAIVGPNCRIAPHVLIGAGVTIGRDCRIGNHASLSHTILAERVFIYPGARIGQDGFGFDSVPTEKGFLSVPQLGRVVIENDVEVGANSTIDRGSASDTVIGAGSRLDNLVQIGHNVRLGRCCIVVAQAGIAGSTVLGDYVVLAAQAGLAGHLTIGRQAKIGAQAGVMHDVAEGAELVGSPAQPVRQFFREVAFLRRLVKKRMASAEEEAG